MKSNSEPVTTLLLTTFRCLSLFSDSKYLKPFVGRIIDNMLYLHEVPIMIENFKSIDRKSTFAINVFRCGVSRCRFWNCNTTAFELLKWHQTDIYHLCIISFRLLAHYSAMITYKIYFSSCIPASAPAYSIQVHSTTLLNEYTNSDFIVFPCKF